MIDVDAKAKPKKGKGKGAFLSKAPDGPMHVAMKIGDFERLSSDSGVGIADQITDQICWNDSGDGIFMQSEPLEGEDLERVRSALRKAAVFWREILPSTSNLRATRSAPTPALTESTAPSVPSKVILESIAVECIDESPTNPRRTFTDLEDLAADIRRRGILQPVLLRPRGDRFELVFGARRFRAAKLAGLSSILATVRELSDVEVLETQLVENAKRSDVHPLEEADAYRVLHEQHKHSVEEIASKVGRSSTAIYARLKLCALCLEGREAFFAGQFTLTTALMVARVPNEELQRQAVKELTTLRYDGEDRTPSARQVSEYVRRKFMLRLAIAPFRRDDADLVPSAGACTGCSKRTGAQPALFEDVESDDDMCIDPVCHRTKVDAEWARRQTAAKASGQRILTEKESTELFPYGDHVSQNSGFVDLAEACWEDAKRRPWKAVLGKHAPAPMLVRDPLGGIHEVLPKADVSKALKASGQKTKFIELDEKDPYSAQEKKRKEKARASRVAAGQAIDAIVGAVAKREPNDALWRIIAFGLVDGMWSEVSAAVANRRHLLGDGKRKHESDDALRAKIAELKGGDLRGLVVELAVSKFAYNGQFEWEEDTTLRQACELFKVDLKKLQADSVASLRKGKKGAG